MYSAWEANAIWMQGEFCTMVVKSDWLRTTATLLPTLKLRFLYSSEARTSSSVGSPTMTPDASFPRAVGNVSMG